MPVFSYTILVTFTNQEVNLKQSKGFIQGFFLRFLIISTLAIVIVAFFAYSDFNSRVHEIQENKTEILNLERNKLQSRLESTISDVSLLSKFHKIADTLYRFNSVDPFHWRGLKLMASSKPMYYKIRFIDSTGHERIRIENTSLTTKSDLQDKAERYYFKQTIHLEENKIFISPLDLNKENKNIEVPLRPTLRFSSPLNDWDENRVGIIVVNYAAQNLLNDLSASVSDKNTQFFLTNRDGYYLKHHNESKEWGFMIPERKEFRLQNEYPEAWKAINESLSGNFYSSSEGIFSFQTFRFPVTTEQGLFRLFTAVDLSESQYRSWVLISRTPVWYITRMQNNIMARYGAFLFIILIIAAVYSYESTSSKIRKRREERLRQEKLDFVKQIIEGLPHPLFFANEKMECVLSNHAFEEHIKSYPHNESFFGKNIHCKVLHIQTQIDYVMKNKQTITFEKHENHEGIEKDYFYKLAPVTLTDETGVVGVATDITDLKSTERDLRATQEELKELNESKDKFFSIIAHDLKSPFNAILGFVEILDNDYDEMDDEEKREIIQNINYSSRKTFRLLQDILQWSRVQLGRMSIEPEQVYLHQISKEVKDLYLHSLEEKNIEVDISGEKDIFIYADKYMLTTIFRNLMSNAIKFTPEEGKISLLFEKQENNTVVRFKDTGVGMSPDIVENLFRLDKNISTKGTNNESGTGLGLVLVKEFLEKNNSSIEVSSEPGKGSTFTLYFPIV